jgi:hypothetical protein
MTKEHLLGQWARLSETTRIGCERIPTVLLKGSPISLARVTPHRKDTDNAEVDTKIVTDKPEKVSINYKLNLVNEEWKSTTSIMEEKTVAQLNSLVSSFWSRVSTISANLSYFSF